MSARRRYDTAWMQEHGQCELGQPYFRVKTFKRILASPVIWLGLTLLGAACALTLAFGMEG